METSGGASVGRLGRRGRRAHLEPSRMGSGAPTPVTTVKLESVKCMTPPVTLTDPPSATRMMECSSSCRVQVGRERPRGRGEARRVGTHSCDERFNLSSSSRARCRQRLRRKAQRYEQDVGTHRKCITSAGNFQCAHHTNFHALYVLFVIRQPPRPISSYLAWRQ